MSRPKKSDVPPLVDSSDSDHVIDRNSSNNNATKTANAASNKKKRRRRRRNSQKLTRKSTPGIMDQNALAVIQEASGPSKRPKLSHITEAADKYRTAATVQGVPTVKPITDAIATFAMAARVSSRTMRTEIAQGIGDAVDADLQEKEATTAAAAAAEKEDEAADATRAEMECDMPDEFRIFFSDHHHHHADEGASDDDTSSVIWKILMEQEEKRDREYRKPTAQYYSTKIQAKGRSLDPRPELCAPDLGEPCSKDYCLLFMCEPLECAGSLEGPCVRGRSGCVAMFLPQTWPDTLQTAKPEAGFVMKRFWRPEQWRKIVREGKLPETATGRMCLFCYRWTTTRASFAMRSRGISVPWMEGTVIQDHWNPVSESGGYTSHDMLPMAEDKPGQWTGLIKPFVMWRANSYEASTRERTVYDEDEGCDVTVTVRCYTERDQDF